MAMKVITSESGKYLKAEEEVELEERGRGCGGIGWLIECR